MRVLINFYFAEWCPHCHDFMDTWNSIKRKLLKLGFEVNEYKSGTEIGDRMISRDNVPGFPTIMVFIDGDGGKDGKKYDIPIVGDSDEMVREIISVIENPVTKEEHMNNMFIDNVKKIMDGRLKLGGGDGGVRSGGDGGVRSGGDGGVRSGGDGGVRSGGDGERDGSYLYPNEDYYKYKYLKYKYKYLKNKDVI